jgi:hypothetical protein
MESGSKVASLDNVMGSVKTQGGRVWRGFSTGEGAEYIKSNSKTMIYPRVANDTMISPNQTSVLGHLTPICEGSRVASPLLPFLRHSASTNPLSLSLGCFHQCRPRVISIQACRPVSLGRGR